MVWYYDCMSHKADFPFPLAEEEDSPLALEEEEEEAAAAYTPHFIQENTILS